jgi:hypothetical protein
VTRLGLALALVAAIACAGAAAQQPPFDSLPFAPPGALPGRIVYETVDGCEFHSFDLRSGTDSRLAATNCGEPGVFSWDGRLSAARVGSGARVRVLDVQTGKRLWLGPRIRGQSKAFSFPLFFSPDSTRLAYCTIVGRGVRTIVVDARTGAGRGRVRGTCAVAYTRRGLAVVRSGRIVLGRRVLYRPPRRWRLAPGIGTPVAANPSGSLLAVAIRRSRRRVDLVVVDLAGRVRGRYRGTIPIPLSPEQLAPHGRSAVVWWGCILQLAPFDRTSGQFGLLYGDEAEPITYPAYSPTGSFAVMARTATTLAPAEPPPPPPAVVFDGNTFAPLYRLPFAASSVAWVPE